MIWSLNNEKTKNDNLMLNLKRTWKYIKQARMYLVEYGLVSSGEAIIGTILPLLSAQIILNITNGIVNQLVLSAVSVFIVNLVLYTLIYFKGFFYQKIYQKTLILIQKSIAKEILNLEVEEIDKNSSEVFIDCLNKYTQDIVELFMVIFNILHNS